MKKAFVILLALALLFAAGCGAKEEPPAVTETAAPEETTAPETTVPETTVPEETEAPLPKLVDGTIQGDHIPAILWFPQKGETVEVTGYADDAHATVKGESADGILEAQLLRFAGEEAYESWTAYARYNTALYSGYTMTGEPVRTLKTNTALTILDELEECYLVQVGEDTGYIVKTQAGKWPITDQPQNEGGSSGGQDGGDIQMAFCARLQLLRAVTKTGSAQIRADGGAVVLKYFSAGDTVRIVAEEGFAPELAGYVTILEGETYAYVPEAWVRRDAAPAFESWDGFAGYNCYLYSSYELRGASVKQIRANTPVTVLWQAGNVCLISADGTVGYASGETLRTAPVPENGGGNNGGNSSDSGSWTPPVL